MNGSTGINLTNIKRCDEDLRLIRQALVSRLLQLEEVLEHNAGTSEVIQKDSSINTVNTRRFILSLAVIIYPADYNQPLRFVDIRNRL